MKTFRFYQRDNYLLGDKPTIDGLEEVFCSAESLDAALVLFASKFELTEVAVHTEDSAGTLLVFGYDKNEDMILEYCEDCESYHGCWVVEEFEIERGKMRALKNIVVMCLVVARRISLKAKWWNC